ncbi:DEAD/DEAH box helicase [Microbacterium terrisoli]|uniref:DEAD/DEAH box helicase n=1 Tax=Microbacterium terrisoli TaxID=3242192 RepID=UPI0028051FA5|nr:DEAD/DEAH box helicase [Microbacterium protaetiae]
MPKNKKPAGGRPSRNFDPRYGSKPARRPGESSFGKAGSKSPGHRGYRAAEQDGAQPKRRWSAQEKAGRDAARGIRGDRRGFEGGSARRDDGASSRGERAPYRGGRPSYRGERPSYQDDRPRRDDRPSYRDDRSERGGRPSYRDDRPRRDARPSYRDDRPRRDDRPAHRGERTFDRNDRPAHRDDRPRRDDRPSYGADRSPREGHGASRFHGTSSHSTRDRSFPVDRDRRAPRDEHRTHEHRTHEHRTHEQRTHEHRTHEQHQHDEHIDVVHERLRAETVQADAGATASFIDLGLGQNIVNTLADLGAEHPFPIQAATLGPILDGKHVLARGRTGSGKTIAFGAPLVESLLRGKAGTKREFGRLPQAIILAPTRELALQIDRTVQPIARSVGLFTTQIYGGVPQARQVGALKKGVDIVIGTPGRIEDLIDQGKLDLSDIRITVLDEADHMSELGFLEPMQRILRQMPASAQKLMFSATLDREVATLVDEFLTDPVVFEVAGEDQQSSTIDHRVLVIDHRDKAEILLSLVEREGKTLVFSRTRAYAEMLAEQFDEAGVRAVALHGDLNQAKRSRNLQRLTDGKVNVLVATDVAARGIHVDDIGLVIQADAPDEYKTYLHRAGRTGRAGHQGTVVTLIPRQRRRRMTEMLERAEIEAPFEEVRPGDDLLEELTGRQVDPVA